VRLSRIRLLGLHDIYRNPVLVSQRFPGLAPGGGDPARPQDLASLSVPARE